ncbi:phage tail tape measure protein [Elizabethkingia anophelis]|uniref:phage tail tape measure protein n=1 Tax=Elizabethkingia anophelis TaxID=1117645 RepID=UPI0024E224EC|nr:phage tail tape measure protein [Elizabethkingia anophelis]MCT4162135.1 hypothetical protein [Elizabethkingia anophelis]CAH1144048.1 hypothetical protein EAVNVB490_01609 [Elizabethkingia anophelis]CAI9670532.1 hypothetical protein EAVNNN508_01608 [Elizabethkingia anophelis]CAI9673192.1 hypothetical protein EAVNVB490_00554 [Elizabethkingia anophelis]CAI9678090.1 hypothetical protein EAVNNN508_00552 [Elizabethkingia anophelis]
MASGTRITTTGVLYINGQQVENTFNNVSRITRRLEQELRRLPPGTREFIETAEQLRRARSRLQEVRDEINNVSNSTQRATGFLGFFRNGIIQLGETFRQVFTADLASRFFDLIISKGKETVDQLLKIADAMTDVQKTSGMSLDQVKQLWDDFDKMDTRTSKMDRLKIAEIGGRLGVPIAEMKSFVQEIDKAYVALGDSFEGGLEGVVDQLGKVKNLFETTKTMSYSEAINRVGSAMNVLAAQGVASEGNIAQFTMRVGTLPDAVKPAIDKVLGLGAAFEESGIDAQIASSGFSNFMKVAGENIKAFAYSMHMSEKDAKNLLNTKPEEFFLRFAQGMKGLKADETAKVLESLGLNSLEVQKAIGAAANNTDKFRESMKTAAVEMNKMTSLQDEFNQKNNNAPAILEKLKNAWNDIFTSTNIINKFEWIIQLIGYLTGVTSTASDGVLVFKERLIFLWNIIKVVTAALLAYNTVVLITAISQGNLTKITWLSIVADKAKAASLFLQRTALLLYEVALGLVTLNLQRARIAIIAFNSATKMSGVGIIVALITAAVVAYSAFNKELDETTKKQKLLNQVNKEANNSIISNKTELEALLKVAKDETASKEARLAAIKKLNQISPEYLGFLNLENINTQKATDAVKAYTDQLYKNAKAKVLSKKMDEALEKAEDLKNAPVAEAAGKDWLWKATGGIMKLTPSDAQNLDPNMFKQLEKWEKERGKDYAMTMMKNYGSYYEKKNQAVDKAMSSYFDMQNELVDLMKKDPSVIDTNIPTNVTAPDKPKKNREADKAANDLEHSKDAYNKAIEAKTAADKVMLELQRTYEDEKSKIIGVAYTNELNLAKTEYTRQKEDLQTKTTEIKNDINKTLTEIDKLTRDKNETKSPEAKKSFDSTISELTKVNEKRQNLISKNKEIEEQLEKTYQFNLQKIRIEWETKAFEIFVQNEQLRIDKIRSSDEEEIIAISSLTEAKVKLKNNEYLKLTDLELQNIQSLEDAKTALREVADRKMLKAQLESMQLQKAIMMEDIKKLSGPAADKLKEDLAALEIKITQLKSAIQGGKDKDKDARTAEQKNAMNQTDILGFSAAEWEKTWKDLDTTEGKIMAVGMAMKALGNAGQMYAQLQQNLNERELRSFTKNQEKKKKELLKQLNEGYINNEEYQKQMELLQVEMANKKAELEYRQAKADKTARMFSIIGDTAAAIATALKAGPIIGPILAGIVGAMGAVQLGIVSSQPLPERQSFDTGGYTGSGFGTPDSSGYKPAGIVHENEWVAPEWMLYNPQTARIIDYLETVRQGKTSPYAEGGKTTDTKTPDTSINPGIMQMDPQLVYVLSQISDFLEYLKNNGVDAWVIANEENGKQMKKAIKSYDKIINGAKAR